jgi:hypothetical protein
MAWCSVEAQLTCCVSTLNTLNSTRTIDDNWDGSLRYAYFGASFIKFLFEFSIIFHIMKRENFCSIPAGNGGEECVVAYFNVIRQHSNVVCEINQCM